MEVEDAPTESAKTVAHIDDSEYKEGTPVTVQTYNAWWTSFIQEVRRSKAGLSFSFILTLDNPILFFPKNKIFF